MKKYRYFKAQALEPHHELDRKSFSKWYLDQPEDFPQKIIWSDEKMFSVEKAKHSKNAGIWSVVNPYEVDQVKSQGQTKYMVSVFIGDGKILPPYWFVDDDGVPFTQTGQVYRTMLEEHYAPIFTTKFGRRRFRELWFQQDGKKIKNGKIVQFRIRAW